jgi:hypothetical protein
VGSAAHVRCLEVPNAMMGSMVKVCHNCMLPGRKFLQWCTAGAAWNCLPMP